MKRTTVRLPAALLRQAQAVAASRKSTVTELIESGLRLEIRALTTPSPVLEIPICRESVKSCEFAPGLPAGAAVWSLGAWEEWMDLHPGKGEPPSA